MKTSTLLKLAKKHLDRGAKDRDPSDDRRIYICHAIQVVADKSDSMALRIVARATMRMIENRLAPFCDLKVWLDNVHGISCPSYWSEGHAEFIGKLQATRHAWVDSMIAEFQAKGD